MAYQLQFALCPNNDLAIGTKVCILAIETKLDVDRKILATHS
jgi:hypothetical protein